MWYTGIIIILWSTIRKRESQANKYLILWYLTSQFCGFETFRGYNISRIWSKMRKSRQLIHWKCNTFKIKNILILAELISFTVFSYVQKQPPEVFWRKALFKKFINIHNKTPILESLFNKVTDLQACNFIKNNNSTFFTKHLLWLLLYVQTKGQYYLNFFVWYFNIKTTFKKLKCV